MEGGWKMKITYIALAIFPLAGCSIGTYERKAIKTGNMKMYEHVDAYYEAINNPWNTTRREKDSVMHLIKGCKR